MSVNATKLGYARIRNAQRRNNKSTHESKDITNISNNELNQNSETLDAGKHSASKYSEDNDTKGNPMQSSSGGFSLFNANFYAGNLEYINSLIANNNKSAKKAKGGSSQKEPTHKRAKSSLIECSQKPKLKQNNDENFEPSSFIQSTTNKVNFQEASNTAIIPTMKPDVDNDNITIKVEDELDQNDCMKERDLNNVPSTKDENAFDPFFKREGVVRRSMSVEDLRFENKEIKDKKSVTPRYINNISDKEKEFSSELMLRNTNEKSSEKSPLFGAEVGTKNDFLSSLNGFIRYFDKSEATTQRNKNSILKNYFLANEQKGNHHLRKELENVKSENKALKKYVETIQTKMLEIIKSNKYLTRELNDIKLKEEVYQEKIRETEDQFSHIKQRKAYYKDKLFQMQELFGFERNDKENNMHYLKRMIGGNTAYGLDNRGMAYGSNGRDKYGRERDYVEGVLKGITQQTKEKECLGINPLKERKYYNKNAPYSNQYDHQFDKKTKESKHPQKYNLSVISQIANMSSDSEDFAYEESNQSDSLMPSVEIEGSYQRDMCQDIYSSKKEKNIAKKDQQIKYLQERLIELMEAQDTTPNLYEKSQRNPRKQKHREAELNMQNYINIQEKRAHHPKSAQTPFKSEYQLKSKIKSTMENSPPMSINNICCSTIKSD